MTYFDPPDVTDEISKALRLAREAAFLEFQERDVAFTKKISAVVADFGGRGWPPDNPATGGKVVECFVQEFRLRAEIVTTGFEVWLTADGRPLPEGCENLVIRSLVDTLDELRTELERSLQRHAERARWRLPPLPFGFALELAEQRGRLQLQLLFRKASKPPVSSTGINVVVGNVAHSNLVVTAGSGTTTVGTQAHPGVGDGELVAALNLIREELAKSAAHSTRDQDLTECIDDVRSELQKLKPNRTRLMSLLGGIATAIQTVGSLETAKVTLAAYMKSLAVNVLGPD